jgi:flagellar motor switch protein FliN
VTNATLMQAAVGELAAVIGALLDAPGTAEASASAVNVQWAVSLAFSGPSEGTVVLGFDAESAQALAKLVMALEEVPSQTAISDTLLEVCGQALSAVGQRSGFEGLRLVEASIVPSPPLMEPTTIKVAAGDHFSAAIACWASGDTARARIPAVPAAVWPAPAAPPSAPAAPANLDLILDIFLPLTVRFGETEMSLLSLTRLAPGSIIDLGRSPDDPVDVLVNGRLVARGEVVVVSGNYGVRIVEVISAADRLSTVAA